MARTKTTRSRSSKKQTPRRPRSAKRRLIAPEDITRIRFLSEPMIAPQGDLTLFVEKTVGEKNDYQTRIWAVDVDEPGEPRPFTTGPKDSHPRWSPDGERIAFLRTSDAGTQIHVLPRSGGEAHQVTCLPEGSVRGFQWSPDGSKFALAFRETAEDRTKAAAKEREAAGASTPPWVIEHPWYREDGDGYFGAQRFALYVVDAETGVSEKLYEDPLGDFSFAWSPDGREVAVTSNRHRRAFFEPWHTSIYRVDVRSKKVREFRGLPPGPKTGITWSPDGKTLAYASREGTDDVYGTENLELWTYDIDRAKARSLTGGTDYCLLSIALTDTSAAVFGPTLRWAPDSKHIYLLLGWHGESHVAKIARRGGNIEFLTSGKVTHTIGNVVSTEKGDCLGLLHGSATQLDEVEVGEFDRYGRFGTRRLTNRNAPFLKEVLVAKPQSHWVRSADGNRVQVWSLFPPHRAKRGKFPAVLEIHGGPHAMYSVGFFHEFQMLAAAGYAVFYSNPRGSKGYGREHCAAIRGSWGGADWADIQAVTEFMKEHANVDPKRMGVMGGSYGGYMTNWVIGHTRDFAGAITDRCVSNLVSMGGNSDYPQVPDTYWPGNHWDQIDAIWEQSPIRYLGKCKTPTLIIHSEGDLRCNVEQAEQVYSVLSLRGVPTRFVRYPRETSHGMSRGGPPDMRVHRLKEILAWWEAWL